MLEVTERRHRSTNIVARLMGLDGLLLQQASNKQKAGSSEKRFQRNVGDGKTEQGRSKEEQEFKDVFEIPDSVKMDAKRVSTDENDLRVASPQFHRTTEHESGGLGCRRARRTQSKNWRKPRDGFSVNVSSKHAVCGPLKASNVQLQVNHEPHVVPSTIVVLKPSSSHDFLLNISKHNQLPGVNFREKLSGEKLCATFSGSPRYKSRECREIAREITRQIKTSLGGDSMNLSTSIVRGYVADESSPEISENECQSNATTTASSHSGGWSHRCRKRLSERWRMTHKSVDMGVINRSRTLREMLAIPDSEVRLATEWGIDPSVWHAEGLVGTESFGISSRDGWKDLGFRNLTRSRSVPASSTANSSGMRGTHHEAICNDRYVIPEQVIQRDRNKAVKGTFNRKSNSGEMASYISSWKNLMGNILQKQQIEDDPPKPENVVEMANEDLGMPSKCAGAELSGHLPVELNSSNGDLHDLHSHSQIIMETEQPSPVSVLETTFLDHRSCGSECFESLSADLHGLRMQLKLLKLESEAYVEGPMLISSNEDEEGPTSMMKEKVIVDDSREMSYIINVLVASGINDSDPDAFIATWYSSECPVNPLVFEELERQFSIHESWVRSDRKLLFDCINAALLLLYQQFTDTHGWVHPPGWIKNSLLDELHKLLTNKDTKPISSAADKVVASESQWLDLGSEVDVIGREIERLLVQELVEQVVEM